MSYRCSLFSEGSGKTHLPSIPLNVHKHNVESSRLSSEELVYLQGKKKLFYLLSCQSCLSHSSDETHQTLKHTDSVLDVEWIDIWKKKKVSVSAFLTLSPMDPAFPVTPDSPFSDKYVTITTVLLFKIIIIIFHILSCGGKIKSIYSP